jgi:FkbM family methyltransferase
LLNRGEVLMENMAKNIVEGDVDKVVHSHFFAGGKGVFVDVGAARPDFLSISALYRDLGWRVIAVEPNPDFCELQRKTNAEVLQYACGDHDEDDVDFTVVNVHDESYMGGAVSYESFSSLGIKKEFSALKSGLDEKIIKVKLRRLDSLLEGCVPSVETIDILSIDVEGWEMEVLDGLNMNKYRPKVMILENLFRSRKYVSRLNKDGYVLWQRYYPNDVYVASISPYFVRKTRSFLVALIENITTTVRIKIKRIFNQI